MHRPVSRWSATVAVAAAVAICPLTIGSSAAAGTGLSLSIVGKHFVDGSGHVIRLLGVNRTSSEYACVDGFGYDDGHFNSADAAAIKSWGANAVRIPLNEDCWLGLNGQPNNGEGGPPLTPAGYQQEIERYVGELNAHGLYAILDLHWTAPGAQVALEQQPMPDQDHSPAFWSSVATVFKKNQAVAFDLFNEPYDPTDGRSGEDLDQDDKITWGCWETGEKPNPIGGGAAPVPCYTQAYDDSGASTTRYQVAGLQTLLDAIRNAGAKQPVLAGGLDYANDLGQSDGGKDWMNHAPDDPLNREAASFHNYMGRGKCDTATCWSHTIAPIAKHVPVVTGEFAEDNFDEAKCPAARSTFDAKYMKWADSAGVSYLAWAWIVVGKAQQDIDGCSDFVLIKNYSKYTPAPPNGVALYDHLRALATKPAVPLGKFRATVPAGDRDVRYSLRSAVKCSGALDAKTVQLYAAGGRAPRRISIGAAHFSLAAGKVKTLLVKIRSVARTVLKREHSLAVKVTLTLTAAGHRRTVLHRMVTLHR